MLSLNQLSPVDDISAKIQSKIAKFLMLKEKILELTKSPSVSISTKARVLFKQQEYLEKKLNVSLKQIEQMKEGSWSFSNIASLGMFYASMEKHVKKVKKLDDENKNVVKPALSIIPELTPVIIGIGVVAVYFLFLRK